MEKQKNMKYIVDQKHRLAIEVLLIFVLPVALLRFGLVPLSLRLTMLVCIAICVIAIVVRENWSWQELGFRTITVRGFLLYALATLLGIGCVTLYARGLPLQPVTSELFIERLLLTFIPISFFQELLFRGFLIHMLQKVYDDRMTIVLYNALLFALLHSIYPFAIATFPLVFLGGMFFAVLYMQEPNIFLITFCHAILNFVALMLGFFVIS